MLQFSSRSDTPGDAVIADNVKRLRSALGLSQAALAEAMRERGHDHWHQTTVSRVESARQGLRLGDVAALNEILRGNVLQDAAMFSEEDRQASLAKLDSMFLELMDAELSNLELRAAGIAQDVRALRERLDRHSRVHEPSSSQAASTEPQQRTRTAAGIVAANRRAREDFPNASEDEIRMAVENSLNKASDRSGDERWEDYATYEDEDEGMTDGERSQAS